MQYSHQQIAEFILFFAHAFIMKRYEIFISQKEKFSNGEAYIITKIKDFFCL